MQAVIVVDGGAERVEPLYEAHFLETAPGDHKVEVSIRGTVPGPTLPQAASARRGWEDWWETRGGSLRWDVATGRFTP